MTLPPGFEIESSNTPQGFQIEGPALSPEDQALLSPKTLQLPISKQREVLAALKKQQTAVTPEAQISPTSAATRGQQLEALRASNPTLASIIEEMTPLQAAGVGFQQGLRTVARGGGRLVGADVFPDVEGPGLQELQDVSGFAQFGKITGEAAPFVAAAPLTGTVGTGLTIGGRTVVPQVTSTAGRAAATGGLGATEAATITAGEGGTPGEIATSGVLGGVIGAGAEVLPAVRRGRTGQLPRSLVDEGEELLRRSPSSKEIRGAIDASAPTIDQLFDASKNIFDEVDQAGIKVRPARVRNLVVRLRQKLERNGLNPKTTPQASAALEQLNETISNPTFRNIDIAREVAQTPAGNIQNRKEAALGSQIIDEIDDFLRTINNNDVVGGNVGNRVRVARDLWGRARRSQMIERALEKAQTQATGFENGIRRQFDAILRSDKKRRFFNADEIAAMERVVKGSRGANLFKLLGKFGLSENQATNMLGASIGAGGGAAIGSAIAGSGGATVGVFVLPLIGQVSKKMAQRLTENNAQFANRVIRAGRNGNKIARAYLASTPADQRSAAELSQLLMRNDINLDNITGDIAIEAAQIARRNRATSAAATGAALASIPVAAEDE